MRVLLCTPDCGPLPLSDWMLLADLGFDGIRTDVRRPGDAAALVANVTAAGKDAIFIADDKDPDECLEIVEALAVAIGRDKRDCLMAVEVGNEPDRSHWKPDPDGFGQLVAQAYDIVRRLSPDTRVVSGGIASLSPEALGWLERALVYIPQAVAVGFHPYRDGGPRVPRPGYKSRTEEMAALSRLAGDHMLWCTEIGWHTAPRRRDFPLCFTSTKLSDGEVAAYLREELRIEYQFGAEVCCIFQIQDGPSPTEYEHRFGIRRTDGTLKPSAYAVREWRG